MADENVRTGTNEDDDDPLIDQLTADQHSSFLDDEELNDQRSGETDSDDQTSLTAAHQGARATSVSSGGAAANSPFADGEALDPSSERATSQANSAAGTAGDVSIGANPANGSPFDLDLDVNLEPGQQSNGETAGEGAAGGRSSATFDPNQDATGTETASVSAGQSVFGDIAAQVQSVFANIGSVFNSVSNTVLEVFNSTGAQETGQSTDQGGQQAQNTSGDDTEEIIDEEESDDQSSSNSLLINGTSGDDTLDGGTGDETLNGYDGDDQLDGGAGDDVLNAGAGNDYLDGGAGDDTLDGGADADSLIGGTGADSLDGGLGGDTLDAGDGADTLDAGDGDDVLIWDSADTVIDGAAGTDTLRVNSGDANFTTFAGDISNIETIDLQSDTGANTVTLSVDSVLDMTDSGNTLTITGNAGDSLEVGTDWTDGGVDANGYQIYTQVSGAKTATLLVDADISINANILSIGGGGGGGGGGATAGDDTLTGTAAADSLDGLAGNDSITGAGGDDTLTGGTGSDTLSGGTGDDVLVWDSSDAVIDGGVGTDTLQVGSGDADFTTFGGSITNIETVDLQSDTGANTVTLSAQNVLDMTDNGNTLTITGDAGDSLEAGNGWTDGGFDGDGNQIYTQVVGSKTATLLVDPDITANADIVPDVATAGDDILTGTAADDTFDGLAGDDSLTGNGGDDILTGGIGDDTMLGGAGDDTFTYSDADFDGNAWTDTVDGFAEGGDLDVIDLTGVSQGWTLEVDGAGAGAEATDADKPSRYTGDDMSGTITFDDGSTIAFDNIEKVDW